MRIIFLNSWFGRVGKAFLDFVNKQSKDTDIFCFTEVTPELFENLKSILKNHEGLYEKGNFLKSLSVVDGMAIFLKNGLKHSASSKLNIYRNSTRDTGFAQYVSVDKNNKTLHLLSVHGKTHPGHKFDTGTRINQSKRILNFFDDKDGPKIIGGDFNLMPDTISVKMFEKWGYRNLIREFGIKSTRNRISWEQFKDQPGFVKQYFADYAFITKEIKVDGFSVPDLEISDHLPLVLDFEA